MRHARGAELLAWPVLSAVLVTALNDHVLKAMFPGPITGKISDFSGLFFFPFLLTTLLGSLRWLNAAAVATGVAFIAVKVTGMTLGPFRIVADPTDLAALLVLPAAILYGRWRWSCDAC